MYQRVAMMTSLTDGRRLTKAWQVGVVVGFCPFYQGYEMETLHAAAFAERIKRLTEAAYRGTLTEAVITHHVRSYVRIRDADQTQSIGIAWMDERPDLFHRVVAKPIEFHRQFLSEGPYAKLLLTHRDYVKAALNTAERKALIQDLVRAHSVPNTNWVNNALSLGIEPYEVRALVRERIELDVTSGTAVRPSSFTQAFLTHGQTFEKSLTPYVGVWHLLGKDVFFEIAEEIATVLPNVLLSRMRAIREEFHAPTARLIELCVGQLHSLQEVDMELLTSVKVHKLYQLLFRMRVSERLRADVKSLFILLRMLTIRLDHDLLDPAVLRVRGMLQEAYLDLVFAVMREVFDSVEIDRYASLKTWADELELGLKQNGWIFVIAQRITVVQKKEETAERIGCIVDGRRYLHDRYSSWSVNPGTPVMFDPSQARELANAAIVVFHPLSPH